jgi:O-antigen/teichoic acid export membrane protein
MNLAFKRMGLRTIIIAIGGGLKIFVITHGYGLIGLSVVQLIVTSIIGISYYIVVKRNVGWFGFGKTNFSKVLQYSKLSGWYIASSVANMLLEHSDKILLGFIASPVLVSYYTLTSFLPNAMRGMLNRVIIGIVPGIGKLLGLQENEKLEKVLRNINNLTFLLTTATGITIT